MLQRLGVEVLDERPYALTREDGSKAWVYDFGLRLRVGLRPHRRGARALPGRLLGDLDRRRRRTTLQRAGPSPPV
ncbi:hypothetical protein [Kitasatospora albolonga]|uniref:hypothetical protein n=1 Tax=Kitasatospora albolonga TaxID=68173 RepID=UPI0031F04AED